MKKLDFFDSTHTYMLDGEEIPSVSEISRFASREIYNESIDKFILDNAKERGKAIHESTEQLDLTGKCDISVEYTPYVNAYVQFRKDYNIKNYIYIEKPLAHSELKYAGTLDRVYEIDKPFADMVKKQCKVDISDKIGQVAIIDLKTSSAVKKPLAQIQLPAYAELIIKNIKLKVGCLLILQLKKDGRYKVYYFNNNLSLFNNCLCLHNALKKKKRKREK